MRFSLSSLLLVVTLLTIPFAWLYDHRVMSERNRKMTDEISGLSKDRKKVQAFVDAAKAEIRNLAQKLRDYDAAQATLFRELKDAQDKRRFSTAGLSEAIDALLIDLHNAEGSCCQWQHNQ